MLTSKRSLEKMPLPSKSPLRSGSLPTWFSSVHCWPEKGKEIVSRHVYKAIVWFKGNYQYRRKNKLKTKA